MITGQTLRCLVLFFNMNEQIKISPKLLRSVASLYTTPHRVLIEYVDNAFDAAKLYYDSVSNSYSKPIEISITFDGKSHDYARIVIQDNCTGINNLRDLVSKIGYSSKLGDVDTNGQFGFGIYSFLAICDSLIITSRLSNSYIVNRVELNAKMFDTPEAGIFNVIEEQQNISGFTADVIREDCWSRFKLEGFTKQAFQELSVKTLKTEIENHFELLLRRNNLVVKIIDNNKSEHICKAFDYSKYPGETFTRKIDSLQLTKSRKYKTTETVNTPNEVEIFLKISKGRELNRRPVFVIKGRRIIEVADVKAFRTYSKSSIWSHPNVTGYIDVTGVLEPTIARNEFKAGPLGKALFAALNQLEPEIKKFVSEQLVLPSTTAYKNLEKYLTDTLNRLSDSRRFRNILNIQTGDSQHLKPGAGKETITTKITLRAPVRIQDQSALILDMLKDGNSPNLSVGSPVPGISTDDRQPIIGVGKTEPVNIKIEKKEITLKKEAQVSEAENSGVNNRNKSGISIIIDSESEPALDSNNNKLRSTMISNQIIIYAKHSSFAEKVKNSSHGVKVIGQELVTYLAIEIITQIKLLVYRENKDKIKEFDALLLDFSDGVHMLCSELKNLEGKNLQEIK
jgi:hypothetical protein